MQTNIIWTRYLLFGISFLPIVTSILGCSEGETLISYRYDGTYKYHNDSGIDLTLEVYNRFDDLIYTEEIPNSTTLSLKLDWPDPFWFEQNRKNIGSAKLG